MHKYVLVKLLERLDEGTEFSASHWPLHITLVANFVVDWENANLSEKLSNVLAQQPPIQVTAGEDEYFGPEGKTRVTIMNMTDELKSLHHNLVSILRDANAVFDAPQYIDDGYRAHATVQREIRINQGDVVNIDELTVVDMTHNGDTSRRKVLRTIKFSAE